MKEDYVIGLHFALNGLTDMELVRRKIPQEIHVLSEMLGFEITEFSIHRPSADVLRENIKFPVSSMLIRMNFSPFQKM